MEALVLILAEAVVLLIGAMVQLITVLVPMVVTIVTELVIAVVGLFSASARRRYERRQAAVAAAAQAAQTAEPVASTAPASIAPVADRTRLIDRPWFRRLRWIGAGLAALLVVGVLVVELFFAEAIVRSALARAEGQRIEVEELEASLLGASVAAAGITAVGSHAGTSYDLRIERLELDASLWDLVWGERRLRELRLSGVRGAVDAVLPERDGDGLSLTLRAGEHALVRLSAGSSAERPEPTPWRIDQLEFDDFSLDLALRRGGRALAAPLAIERFAAAPLESGTAAFDLLYRSTMRARPGEARIAIHSSGDDAGRTTTWRVEALPVTALGAAFGPPWDVLTAGHCDVVVDDRWRRHPSWTITMDYRVALRELELAPDEGRMRRALVSAVEAGGGALDLRGELTLGPQDVDAGVSTDLEQLALRMFLGALGEAPEGETGGLRARAATAAKRAWGWLREDDDADRADEGAP